MQIVTCKECNAKNRVDADRLANGEAKCGRCGTRLEAGSAAVDSKPLVLSDQTFGHEVLGAQGEPVLVDCWAPWCGPCRIIGPVIDELAAESQGKYRVGKLNVDENPQTASRFKIASIPTLLIFKDGKLIDRLVGVQPKQTIAERLRVASRTAA